MRQSIDTKIILGFFVITAILGVIGYVAYNHVARINDLNDKTLSTYEILTANQEVFALARDMETGGRGYMLTGQGEYLQPFYSAAREYPDRLAVLKRLAQDRPAIRVSVDTLAQLLDRRKVLTQLYIDTRQQKGLQASVAELMKGEGLSISARIRTTSRDIRQKEAAALQVLLKENYRGLQDALKILIGLIAVIIFTLLLVLYLLKRDISGRIKAEKQLQDLNRDLEEKVEQRTEDLKRSFEDTEAKVKFRNLELEKQNRELLKKVAQLEARK